MMKQLGLLSFWNWNTKGGTKYFSRSAELVTPKKLGCFSLICGNFEKMRKVLLNHVECVEI